MGAVFAHPCMNTASVIIFRLFYTNPWDWGQISIKLGTKHVTYQKLKNDIFGNLNVFITGKNIMQRGGGSHGIEV